MYSFNSAAILKFFYFNLALILATSLLWSSSFYISIYISIYILKKRLA